MRRPWWVRRLFGRRVPVRPATTLAVARLDDRVTPANLIEIAVGGLTAVPAGATTFADTADYVIDPSALAAAGTTVLRANTQLRFLDPVTVAAADAVLDAQANGGIEVVADLTTAGRLRFVGRGGASSSVGIINLAPVSAGSLDFTGFGGDDPTGFNYGLQVAAPITATGPLTLTGTGGTGPAGSNDGVYLEATATAGGRLTVAGSGGAGGASAGVLTLAVLTSTADRVDVTGTGGGDGGDAINNGVWLFNATVTGATGVALTGTGGAGTGGRNDGVLLSSAGVTATAGRLDIRGAAGGGADSFGVRYSDGKSASPGGTTKLVTDSLDIGPTPVGSVSAARVEIQPATPGLALDLGGADAAGVLGLSAAELLAITADALAIGDTAAGDIVVSQVVGLTTVPQLELTTAGSATTADGAQLVAARLAVSAGVSVGSNAAGEPAFNAAASVIAAKAGGGLFVNTTADLTVGTVGPLTGLTAGGDISLFLPLGNPLAVAAPISGGGPNVELVADGMAIGAAVSAPAGSVRLFPTALGRPVVLGGAADPADSLNLSDAEFRLLSASELVQIGDNLVGPVTVAGPLTAPGGVTTLVIASGETITDEPSARITVPNLGVFVSTGKVVTLDAGHAAGKFAFANGTVTFVNDQALVVGPVADGLAGLTGLTGVAADVGTTAGDLTLSGPVSLTAGLRLAVATAGGGGTATVPGDRLLTVPAGATVVGGAGDDVFAVGGSAGVDLRVDGGDPDLTFPPTAGDTLRYTAGGDLTIGYATLTSGRLGESGKRPVGFSGVETLDPVGGSVVRVDGTGGDDYLLLTRDATGTTYRFLNPAGRPLTNPVPVGGAAFAFAGGPGRDTLKVQYAAAFDPLAGLTGGVEFDGTDAAGDLLAVFGTAGFSATYTPTAAGEGTVAVAGGGARTITFRNLTPVELTGFAVAAFAAADPANALAVADGASFLDPARNALRLTGTAKTGGPDEYAVEELAAWGNGEFRVVTAGTAGPNAVAVASAASAHANTNLTIASEAVTVTGDVAAAGVVRLTNTGALSLGAVTIQGGSGVVQDGAGAVALAGDVVATAPAGDVSFASSVGGTFALALAAGGNATLAGTVGVPLALTKLLVTAPVIRLGGQEYRTTGTQSFTGAVTFDSATVAVVSSGGGVSLSGTVAGATDLSVGTVGGLTLGGAVSLNSLAVTGTTLVSGSPVQTVGGQTYTGDVAVAVAATFRSTAAGTLTFGAALAAPGEAVVVATDAPGRVTFGGPVTAGGLTLTGSGEAEVKGGAVTTAGGQSYAGPVLLSSDTLLTATTVSFAKTLDSTNGGPFSVQIKANATFGGAVGRRAGARPLASLTVDGPTTVAGGAVRTTGGQSYNGPVGVQAATTFDTVLSPGFADNGVGPVAFGGPLSGPVGVTVATAGETTFGGPVGVAGLTTDGGGLTRVASGQVTTTGSQTYLDAVLLGTTVTFTAGGDVRFDSSLASAAGQDFGATVDAAGVTRFGGTVGDGAGRLGSLASAGGGQTQVAGALVNTSGPQSYTDDVALAADAAFTSGVAGAVAFAGKLDGPGAAVVTTAAATTFGGAVGTTPLAALTVNGGGTTAVDGPLVQTAGSQTFADPVSVGAAVTFRSTTGGDLTFVDSLSGPVPVAVETAGTSAFQATVTLAALTTDTPGASRVQTDITTTGLQQYGDSVTLTGNVTFAGSGVTFSGALVSAVDGGLAAGVNSPGRTRFGGPVGDGAGRLKSLATDPGGTTEVGGGVVRTVLGQSFGDDVALTDQPATTFTAGGPVAFGGKLDAGTRGLSGAVIDSPAAVTLAGPVGSAPLAFLTVQGGGPLAVGPAVTTTGDQTYLGPVSAAGSVAFRSVPLDPLSSDCGTGAVRFLYAGPAVGLTAAGVVTASTDGEIVFEGDVRAAGLVLDCGGRIDLNGSSVDTGGGDQLYAGDVLLTADVTLTAGAVTFNRRIDSEAGKNWALAVTANAVFVGDIGSQLGAALGALTVTGASRFSGSLVATAKRDGGQTYTGPVVLTGNTTFQSDGGPVAFVGRLSADAAGSAGATVRTAGDATFGGAVGDGRELAFLVVDGGGSTAVRGGLVATTGVQLYAGAVRVGGPQAAFAAGGPVTFDALDAEADGSTEVTVTTAADTTFARPVGGSARPRSLRTDGGGTTRLAGGLVAASEQVTFADRVSVDSVNAEVRAGGVRFEAAVDAAGDVPFGLAVFAAGDTLFGGPVGGGRRLAFVSTDAGGRTLVPGGGVRTTGEQQFGDDVRVSDTPAEFVGRAVRFAARLDGPQPVAVSSVDGLTFGGPVGGLAPLASLSVSGGPVTVAGGLVKSADFQQFAPAVRLPADARFEAGGRITFVGTLDGPASAVVVSPTGVSFQAATTPADLTVAGGGETVVQGGLVRTPGFQRYDSPVTVADRPTRFEAGGRVDFNRTLDGGQPVDVRASGSRFAEAVGGRQPLARLVVGGGPVEVAGGLVATTDSQTYSPAVTASGAAANFVAGGGVLFDGTVSGPARVAVDSPAVVAFRGDVSVGGLATNPGGGTRIEAGAVVTGGDQFYGDPVTVAAAAVRFQAGGAVRFADTLTGPAAVTVAAPGDTTLGRRVEVGGLTTAGGGSTVVAGGSVTTAGGQRYDDSVTTTGGTTFAAGSSITINNTFNNPDGRLTLRADAGVSQTAGVLTAADGLTVGGAGKFDLDQLGNVIPRFDGVVTGDVFVTTVENLTLDGAVGGQLVRLRTDGDFTSAAQPVAASTLFAVYPGLGRAATVRLDSDVSGPGVVLGVPGKRLDGSADDLFGLAPPAEPRANVAADRFVVTPDKDTPIIVYGSVPRSSPTQPFFGTGDQLLPALAGRSVTNFFYDGQDGFYEFAGFAPLRFLSIERLQGLSLAAAAVQTAEPRDGSGATAQQYNVRLSRSQNGVPLPGGLSGQRLPENPFVVSPALVNPAAPTQPPRLGFGDFNGDNVPDLVLGNGPGTPPLVSVVDGRFLDARPDGTFNRVDQLALQGGILAQFYAYDPGFQGGLNVAVGRLDGPGKLATITVGAERGGGPHVRTFRLVLAPAGSFTPYLPEQLGTAFGNFFAYESAFTGGVRVAVADVTGDGQDDLVLAPGAGGGPRVRVFDGKEWAGRTDQLAGTTPAYADFFTVEPSFRGGLYVAAGFYRPDAGRADLVVGAASGGGPRVMVFNADGLTRGTTAPPPVLANFFAFTEAELADPLFGGGTRTGVGGVAFGARGGNGFRDVLVSTGRGAGLRVRQFPGGVGELPVGTAKDLTAAGGGLTLADTADRPVEAGLLRYGASVAGFEA